MESIYNKIKARRKELGMTQDDLAKKIGYYDKSMVSRIERGGCDLPHSKIVLFAKALDMTVADLIGTDDCIESDFDILYTLYHQLNMEGREKVFEYTKDLLELDKYKKHYQSDMVEEEA